MIRIQGSAGEWAQRAQLFLAPPCGTAHCGAAGTFVQKSRLSGFRVEIYVRKLCVISIFEQI